jgi:hypothetical protein
MSPAEAQWSARTAASITLPAQTANLGTIVAFTVFFDDGTGGGYPRTSPAEIRRCRYVRQYRLRGLRKAGCDAGVIGCRPVWLVYRRVRIGAST